MALEDDGGVVGVVVQVVEDWFEGGDVPEDEAERVDVAGGVVPEALGDLRGHESRGAGLGRGRHGPGRGLLGRDEPGEAKVVENEVRAEEAHVRGFEVAEHEPRRGAPGDDVRGVEVGERRRELGGGRQPLGPERVPSPQAVGEWPPRLGRGEPDRLLVREFVRRLLPPLEAGGEGFWHVFQHDVEPVLGVLAPSQVLDDVSMRRHRREDHRLASQVPHRHQVRRFRAVASRPLQRGELGRARQQSEPDLAERAPTQHLLAHLHRRRARPESPIILHIVELLR
mmetsp:Transcript_1261/g.3814  ORF Transcript_1261/g.3814 Transcript_1261/m.3814 type:complete len:283 (-) Transcript_1261:86-934(-)